MRNSISELIRIQIVRPCSSLSCTFLKSSGTQSQVTRRIKRGVKQLTASSSFRVSFEPPAARDLVGGEFPCGCRPLNGAARVSDACRALIAVCVATRAPHTSRFSMAASRAKANSAYTLSHSPGCSCRPSRLPP